MVVMLWLFAAMFTFEMLGVFSTKMVTITQLIKAYVPIVCRLLILVWLKWHFFLSDM